jgi:hypothetical protein
VATLTAEQQLFSPAGAAVRVPPAGESAAWLDWPTAALSTWFIGGVFLDGWAHNHIPELESFFTPWHAVLYSGFAATAALLAAVFLRNRARGLSWHEALPAGYHLSLLGAGIFLAGGLGDMLWHTLFGIEASVDALLSPTHLVLAIGGTMLLSGPFRAWWRRADTEVKPTLGAQLSALLSLTYVWSTITFFTQYVHPYIQVWAGHNTRAPSNPYFSQALGTVSITLQAAILAAVVLLAFRRRPLPFGSIALMLTLNALLMNLMDGDLLFVAAAFLGGLCADVFAAWIRPSFFRADRFRLFAALLPLPLYALYFAVVAATRGMVWSIHLWAGSIAIAGLVSWLVSWLLLPPAVPSYRSE